MGEGEGEGEVTEVQGQEDEEEEEEELQHNFFNLLLVKLLSFHQANSRAVRWVEIALLGLLPPKVSCFRFRSCQLVSKMLNSAVERGTLLQGRLLEGVKAVMLDRIHDKARQHISLLYTSLT